MSGLSARRIRYWAETGFFQPSYRDRAGRAYGRIYSFRDVVGLRTLALLRNEHRVSLQSLREVGKWLSDHYEAPWAELRFFVAGREVYFHDPRTGTHRSGRRPEQAVIAIDLRQVAAATEAEAERLRARTTEEIGRIVQHRYLSHNAPVIAGTRIRTEAIWHFHEAGYDTCAILREYPRLTERDVIAAIDFERRRRARRAG
ncbi:MAG: DUF433 domain-containing protein [Sphaerobacter sp.]|nr:DUF433 domain-containing protein [Sphaerobacter sp.]